jgi:hypothetical protein
VSKESHTPGSSKYPQTTVVTTINVPVDISFDYIVPVDLSRIFKGYKFIAGINRTSIKEGWRKPGLTRTIFFEDGTTSRETLLTVIPPTSFSYKNEEFTSTLRFLTERIEGNWTFTDLGHNQTEIEWTYRVIPKNMLTRILIKAFLLGVIHGMLAQALRILKSDLESGEYKNAT